MVYVKITKGHHRGQDVVGTFPLVKEFRVIGVIGGDAGEVTVSDPNNQITWKKTDPVRVKVLRADFSFVDEAGTDLGENVVIAAPVTAADGSIKFATNYEQKFTASETDEEAMSRIRETFQMLDKITDAVGRQIIRGLVVSGPPGVGKSYGVEAQLEKADLFRKIGNFEPSYEIVTGGVSPIGLYQKLWKNKAKGRVLAFDDSDGILFDEECLSLLKGALNSGDRRRIAWNKESRVLASEGIDDHFDFEGGIIFITNVDFERTIARGSRIGNHLNAIMSRCHYLDLKINSMRDKLLRIKQVCDDGMLTPYEFSKKQEKEVLDFVFQNADYLREISLRMVKKIADFVKADPNDWHSLAEATTLETEARFKRLLAKKQEAEAMGVVINEQ